MNQNQHPGWSSAITLLFFLLVATTSSIQVKAQTSIAVAPSKMNVLYVGIDNPVSIAASGSADENISVSIEGGGGKVEKDGTGSYNVRVTEITDNCVVKVYVDGKLAGTSSFRVRNLPLPSPTIGGFKSGETIAAAAFKSQAGVGTYIMDFPFEVRYQVLGFTLTLEVDKDNVKAIECEGGQFSQEAKQNIEQYVKPGSQITIDKIRAVDPGGRTLKLPSLVYYIK